MTTTRQSIKVPEEFFAIAENLRTQDNAITADPIFMVQRLERTYGFDSAYCENWMLHDGEGEEYLTDEIKSDWEAWDWDDISCDQFKEKHGVPPGGLEKVHYRDTWVNVMPFFTRFGAEAYLKINGHNLGKTRIYVESAYRNQEWIMIREWLMGLKKEEA